jgi:hypothetical protein
VSESDAFQETATGLAVAGAAEAISTSEQAVDTAATGAALAAESLATSEVAAQTSVAAAEVAVEARDEAAQATTAVQEVATGTVSLLDQMRNEVAAEFAKMREEFANRYIRESPPPETPSEVTPEDIPVANEFHAEAGEIANEQPRRSHRFGGHRPSRS